MKKWSLLLLLAVVAGGGAYYYFGGARARSLSEKDLTFAEVQQATIRDIVSATGLVEPREVVVVASETPGTVVRLLARVGDVVSEADVLVQLDERRIQLKIEEARNAIRMADAGVKQAQSALMQANAAKEAAVVFLDRQVKLEKSVGFQADVEQGKAQLASALAGIEAAKAGVDAADARKLVAQTAFKEAELAHELTRIRVPGFSPNLPKRQFLILDRKVHEGQMVGPQAGPLFTLAGSLEVVEVHAQVSEGDINRIHERMDAEFIITGFDDEEVKFPGKVKQIRPQATAAPLSATMKSAVYYDTVIEVKNRRHPRTGEWQLRPGMTASVDIIRREHKDAWRVPSGALNFTLDEAYQSEWARARVAEWKLRKDAKEWRVLWTWDESARQATPVFVRVEGQGKDGSAGLKDAEGNEILEWESGKEPRQPFRVIIGAPPARSPGFMEAPPVKI